MEDIEGLDKDQGHDKKINVNGILTENENIKRSKGKKKKHKDDEKSKKKKRKKVDDYVVCSADDEKHPNSSDNINLWLEDVNLQATSPVLQDIDDKSSKTKKKKDKKKHKKSTKSKTDNKALQSKSPRLQCLVDSNGVKLDCHYEALLHESGNYNAKITFFSKYKEPCPSSHAEVKLDNGQQVSIVGPNPIQIEMCDDKTQNEQFLLKVS